MGKIIALLHLILLSTLWAAIATLHTNQTTFPGCISRCRSVDILYPFGVGEGCYRDKGFEIICNETYRDETYRAFLGVNRYEVGSIRRLWMTSRLVLTSNTSAEGGIFNFTGSPFILSQRTISLDWAIGNQTCKEAIKDSTSYGCKAENSHCDESPNGRGYVCTCDDGYYGNAYLTNGCQVISSECVPEAQGSFGTNLEDDISFLDEFTIECVCHDGWSGDGRRDGIGCTLNQSKRIQNIFIGVGASVGLLVLLVVPLFLLYKKLIKRRQVMLKEKFFKQNGGLLLEHQISSGEGNIDKTKVFVAEELEKATDNFNESRILGRGGSGTVYKGMLPDGKIVAIKKSKVVDESQIGLFINELVILSHINHRHVVQLFGCCLETEVPLLTYEFVSNGTLAHHLHDEECKASISWDNRLRIATEIAGALSYMHSSATTPIFHRDIKCSNILLDENFKAKVSDFGISRSVPNEITHLTTLVQGTFGYLDPEYFHSGQFTDKSDVYSFGIVLVELLTGKKPISSTRPEEEKNLAMHFISLVKESRVSEILETRVKDEGSKGELLVVAKLAKRCLKLVGKKRPTMREVTIELEQLRGVEKQQGIAQYHQDTNNQDTKIPWPSDLSIITISGHESDDTQMTCQLLPSVL